MNRKEYLKAYCAKYHKDTYVSNTSKRDSKNHMTIGKLLTVLLYTSRQNAGKDFSVIMHRDSSLSLYLSDGWSDALAINQLSIAKTVDMSQSTMSRWIAKAEEQGYLKRVGSYLFDSAKHESSTYMVNVSKIERDFNDLWFDDENDLYVELGNKYYSVISKADEYTPDKVVLNNRCMKQSIWRDLKAMIEEANKSLPEKFRVKFLNADEYNNYHDSRYYSCICNSLSPERHENSDRYELINELFGTEDEDITEIDVNSMMYRTTYNLVHDEYLAKDADVYYELYKLMVSEPMSLVDFKKDARECIKAEVMAIYMDPRSVYCKCHNKSEVELNAMKYEYISNKVLTIFGMTYEEFLNRLKEAMYRFLSVYDFEGDKRVFLGSMFFKYEAIVYYYMHEEFKSLGIKTTNVYDGFYFITGTCDEDLFYKVYHKAIDNAKAFLVKYNHNLVKIYGKTYTIKYRVFPKTKTKTFVKKCSYDIIETKESHESSEEIKFLQSLKNNEELEEELIKSGKLIAY